MPSNYTEHYRLSQWEKTDQVLMKDFNADNLAIDGALDGLSARVDTLSGTVASLTAGMAGRGNCKIETRSYSGNGQYGNGAAVTITFSARPVVFFILGDQNLFAASGTSSKGTLFGTVHSGSGLSSSFNHYDMPMKWSGSQVRIPIVLESTFMNTSGQTYQVFAFIQSDA